MIAMTDARTEVVAAYLVRRDALIAEARDDERNRRPLTAGIKRQIARLYLQYAISEEINRLPAGIERRATG